MTIEDIRTIVIIVGWIVSLPLLYWIGRDMCSYYREVEALMQRLSEFQERMDDLEKTVNINTYHICDILNEAEKGKENG